MTDRLPRALTGETGGVFFLHGEDRFHKQEAASALLERHLDPATRDFNLDVLRGTEVDLETLARVLATPPMMAEWRVVLVEEVEALAGSPKARNLLLEIVGAPPPGLALILVATIPEGSRARFYKDLGSRARAVEFGSVSENDLPGWLMARAREQHGTELEEDAARALAAAVGADLGVLARELDKLSELAGEGGPITRAHVAAAGTRLPRQDRWRWFDLVGEKRFSDALEGLGILLSQGESGVGLVIGLGTHLLRLGVLVEEGSGALEDALPPHQRWLVRRLGGQARRWNAPELEDALAGLRRVDQLLKASAFSDEHLLEQWLLTLAARAAQAA